MYEYDTDILHSNVHTYVCHVDHNDNMNYELFFYFKKKLNTKIALLHV